MEKHQKKISSYGKAKFPHFCVLQYKTSQFHAQGTDIFPVSPQSLPTWFYCQTSSPPQITRFFMTTIPMAKIFIFVLQFGEQQVPSKYVLGVSRSAPVLLTPTKYHLAWYLFIQPSHPHNLCPHDPSSIYSRSPKWLSFKRILHIAIMCAVPPPLPMAAA